MGEARLDLFGEHGQVVVPLSHHIVDEVPLGHHVILDVHLELCLAEDQNLQEGLVVQSHLLSHFSLSFYYFAIG